MVFDLFIGIVYFVVIFILLYMYAKGKYKDPKKKKIFVTAVVLKLAASILFGIVYQFYYGFGDCIVYYEAGKEYFQYVMAHPGAIPDFLMLDSDTLTGKYADFLNETSLISDYFNDANIFVHRFCLVFCIPAMFLFFPMGLFFGLISFLGSWKLYNVLSRLYPQYEKFIRISFLFIPSAVFWTSGIGKDAICIGFVNYFVAFSIEAFIFRRKMLLNILLMLLSFYVVYEIKSYIILSITPFFLYFLFSYRIQHFKSSANRFLARSSLVIIILLATVGTLLFSNIVNKISTEIIEGALTLTKGQQSTDFGNESKYDLGITLQDMKDRNIKPFILSSINVALFRPYIWEVHKPLVIFSFLESCFFLFFTIYVFFKGRIIRTFKVILSSEFLIFALGFSIVFAFFTGLVSANFGTLIRYKTPFIGYFLLALFMIRDKLLHKNEPVNKDGTQLDIAT